RSSEDAAIPAAYKASDASWTGFTVLPMVIVYNGRLLDGEVAPRAWSDLPAERFRGRIAYADPSASGSAYTILRTATTALAGKGGSGSAGEDGAAMARFARALGGRILPESTQVIPSVASGEYLVGLSFENAAAETLAAGSELRIVYPADGTSAVPDGVALLGGAKRPEAARRFIDFALGPDVARVLAGRFGRRSARSAAPPPKGLPALSSLALWSYDIKAAAAGKAEIVAAFRAEFARGAD
ncbi:MAG: extracellular solute-binding protein, partial [Spirochaetaceae bacterium]|nr:extracellular solute-binding protein [Spirochaetaceae bacterium]